MPSLSAHLLDDYEKNFPQNLVQSGAMEYNALAHGHQQIPAFSQFSQASIAQVYRGGSSLANASLAASTSMADSKIASHINASFGEGSKMLAHMGSGAPTSFQEMLVLQQQAEEQQAIRTAAKISAFQAKLDKKLGPEFISQRPGPGNGPKLTYIEGWKVINLANEVFGFNGWSSSITSLSVDFIDYNQESHRYSVGVTAIVKVCLRDGVSHEDIGYGMLENCKSKAMALDKCKKEAVTDALKRTLRNFGNALGNCLYDKEYVKEIMKMKAPPPPTLNQQDLHRRKEFVDRPPSTSKHASMAPPPVPKLQPMSTPRIHPASTTSIPKPQSSVPAKPVDSESRKPTTSVKSSPSPAATTNSRPITRATTDDSMYSMNSDDDALFADLRFDEPDVSTSAGISFTDRSSVPAPDASSFDETPLRIAPHVTSLDQTKPSNPIVVPTLSKSELSDAQQAASGASSDRKKSIMAALLSSGRESAVPNETIKPRTSSGGFQIPPGVQRPQRPGQSSIPDPLSSSKVGNKRTAEESETGSHGFEDGSGGTGTARTVRTVLKELEGNSAAVKRPRLS